MTGSQERQPLTVVEGDHILTELRALRDEVPADRGVCVAILDGPVDLSHPCFRGAELRRVTTLVGEEAGPGAMSAHGTHVASVVFGQPASGTLGLAPGCRGLVAPIFRDDSGRLSQLDLARAIERCVAEGADIINISGGERVAGGHADMLLARAVDLCEQSGVLVIAATGNDGCDCVHVPAAVPGVLAVGALGRAGTPLRSSNFGDRYASNGVLAPGEAIPGAVPGGAITTFTGSSFATPVVSALAALLLCEQRRLTGRTDVAAVRDAILAGASPCGADSAERARCLGGTVNVRGAYALINQGGKVSESNVVPAPLAGVVASAAVPPDGELPPMDPGPPPPAPQAVAAQPVLIPAESQLPAVVPSCGPAGSACSCGARPSGDAPAPPAAVRPTPVARVFALGNVGYDFGTEARRDTFRQLMPVATSNDKPPIVTQPNPYDATQMSDYLTENPWESTKVIWTMNLDLTPVYALEAEASYADAVYEMLRIALHNQVLPVTDGDYVSRVSIPGVLTDRTVRLFSGQVVPVVVIQRRGLYAWQETALVDAVVEAIDLPSVRESLGYKDVPTADKQVRLKVRQMLDKVYFDLRNLGTSSPDRAINFMATNAFVFTDVIARGLLSAELVEGDLTALYSLQSITAVKSPYCRIDSDCWDVQTTFFSPQNERQASVVFQTTIDVSDELPVQLAPVHQYLIGG